MLNHKAIHLAESLLKESTSITPKIVARHAAIALQIKYQISRYSSLGMMIFFNGGVNKKKRTTLWAYILELLKGLTFNSPICNKQPLIILLLTHHTNSAQFPEIN